MKMKVAIVDDSIDFINYALKCLSTINDLEIYTFHDEEVFLYSLTKSRYDIVCIDYDLPTCNGYDFIGMNILNDALFILVTHHKSLSLIKTGFKHSIFRYITKDMYATEIVEALEDAKKVLMKKKVITCKVGRGVRTFELQHILAIYSENHNINIVLDDNTTCFVRKPIKEIAQELLNCEFAKSECNTFINLHHIAFVDKHTVTLKNGRHFNVSKSEFNELLHCFLEIQHV